MSIYVSIYSFFSTLKAKKVWKLPWKSKFDLKGDLNRSRSDFEGKWMIVSDSAGPKTIKLTHKNEFQPFFIFKVILNI